MCGGSEAATMPECPFSQAWSCLLYGHASPIADCRETEATIDFEKTWGCLRLSVVLTTCPYEFLDDGCPAERGLARLHTGEHQKPIKLSSLFYNEQIMPLRFRLVS
jgi:hypothetical protein